ncbi:MAG TPA: matrixin family metalloprotease [Planctomycetota bacterium]|jgi:hypothetical protein|nr:matrixin family metalloprotease [Planctomycetota bacterium]
MRAPRLLSPALALAAAALLATPRAVEGFAILMPAFSLNTDTRDVRVFNDWPTASNANQTPDPNFPNALGAPLALWKGAAEWASVLHNGGGAGDPTQGFPDGIGSGQANFDFVYLGEAPTPPPHDPTSGAPTNENDRIAHLAATALGGGVLAITINPGANGWHLEFMPDSVWFDGPGTMPAGDPRFDIQGIAVHELGHALGLAHTTVGTATMFPAAGPGPASVAFRSIELDDRQGVQFIYGVASTTKPRILGFQGIVATQQPLTILGQNFGTGTTLNEVWFRDDAADNVPRKVTGLASTLGGTQITVVPPCDVANGDVFVKKGTTGTTGNLLSNGVPVAFQSGGNGAPCLQCIATISPSPVPILAAAPPEILITAPANTPPGTPPLMTCVPTQPQCPGTAQFSTVTQVDVGPFSLGPSQFTIENDNQIRFTLPLFPSLGAFNVTLTNAGGITCPATLSVTAVTSPVLVTGPPVQTAGSTFTATLGSPLGTNHVLVFSTSNVPSALPGVVSLGIGNGFTNLSFLPTPSPNAAGVSQLQFPIPSSPGGVTVFFQMAAVNISNPFAVLPIPVSNVTSVTVL